VTLTARDPSRARDLANKHGARAYAAKLDVTNAREVMQVVEQSEAYFGNGIDVVVNAAGYNLIGAIEEVSDEELRAVMETHFFGVISVIKATVPGMRLREKGHFFNFSSIAGLQGAPGTAAYSAAKFAIEGMSEALAKEVAPFGIKVTILEPGPFQTSFFAGSGGKTAAVSLGAYAKSVTPYRELVTNPPTWCPGDPVRAANQIVSLAMKGNAPMRLPLGRLAYKVAGSVHRRRTAEMEAFKEVSLAVDFPEHAGRAWPR
jgi:NAD(P)-dependent dehydrogenase (short-subunit alcohol dehydrogenase family)